MPGKRMLYKNICTSEKLSVISLGAEVLFYRLLTQVDDEGRFWGNPATIKDACLPLRTRNASVPDVKRWCIELETAGLINRYTVDNAPYLFIIKFSDFQILRSDVKKRTDYPAPERTRNEPGTNPERIRSAEVKDKVKDKVKERDASHPSAHSFFVKPTPEEILVYCIERKNFVNPKKFFDHYEANGWKVGKNSMKNWKAAVRTWEAGDNAGSRQNLPPPPKLPPVKEEPGTPMPKEVRESLSKFRTKSLV